MNSDKKAKEPEQSKFSFLLLIMLTIFSIGIILSTRYIYKWGNLSIDTDNGKSGQKCSFTKGSLEKENCKYENYVLGQPVEQTDQCLISAFKKNLLIAPPAFEEIIRESVNISMEHVDNLIKFDFIEKLLIKSQNVPEISPGFFIECGANDGLYKSSTLRLEKTYNWTGLLIEANPIPFRKLLKVKRNAWAVNAALCITPYPKYVTFYTNPKRTGLSGLMEDERNGVNVSITVPCIPLYTMLAALEVDTVDFFSLDVEGVELAVLKTIPFDKIKFKVLSIEYKHIPEGGNALVKFLEGKGYKFIGALSDMDFMFVHESLFDQVISMINF